STRSSTSLDTGSFLNPRTARRLVTASYTSMIASLPPAIRFVQTHAVVSSSALTQQGVSAPRWPVQNERRRPRPPPGRRTGTAGDRPPPTPPPPPAPARDRPAPG